MTAQLPYQPLNILSLVFIFLPTPPLIDKNLTMLDAIRTPLTLGDCTKHPKPLDEQSIDDSILSFGFKVLTAP